MTAGSMFAGRKECCSCLDGATGKEIWKVDTRKEYHVHQNFFGVGSVPVVEGDLLSNT